MNRFITTFILLSILLLPGVVHADPLCSDGTPAPAGNICNCGTASTISGGSFTPGSGTGLTGNTFGGLNFSGVGGALLSCTNVGSALSTTASSLLGQVGISSSTTGGQAGGQAGGQVGGQAGGNTSGGTSIASGSSVPTTDGNVKENTTKIAEEEKKTTKREQCLNGAAYAVAKTALQKLSDKTLNWVKTGFNGNPLYVRDVGSYLTSIKNEKLDNYLNQYIGQSNPIFGNALRSVIKEQTTGYNDGRLGKMMYTTQGIAFQKFQDDFTQGGWSAFLNPDNNPIGAYFNSANQLNSIITTTQQDVKEELQQGEGFLSMRKCVEYAPSQSNLSSTYTAPTTYGVPSGSGACSIITSQNYGTCCTSVGGSATNQTQCNAYSHGYQAGTPTTTSAIKAPKCIRYETVTPGSLISNQIKGVTNSTTELLINADKINEVLGSFFDQLMNRLFTNGLSGSGRGSYNATTPGGYGTNVVTGSNGQTLASAQACQTPLGYNPATGGFNDEFDISRPQQLRKIIETQRSYLTRAQDARYIMQSLVPRLGALDYCIPGPNPTWNSGLNENAETFIYQLQEARAKGNNALVTIGGVISPLGGFGMICSIFSNSPDCNNDEHTVGWYTSRVSLFDKTTSELKLVSDRFYSTGSPLQLLINFFSDTLNSLKSQLGTTYSNTAISDAFVAANPSIQANLVRGDIVDAINETTSLVGYAQGIAEYNALYNTNIQTTQDALVELESIYNEVSDIVARAKADHINAHNQPGQTPINLSCINNAYQLGAIGSGLPHLENITSTPDPFIQHSFNSSVYFYSHL